MILITSVSPNHYNSESQHIAIASWIAHGYVVVSLNCSEECDILRNQYPQVHFFSTTKVLTAVFGKPYVSIKAVLEFADFQGYESIMIINSDIIIEDAGNKLPELENKAEQGIVVLNRYDVKEVGESGLQYQYGMDGFIIHKKYYQLFETNFYSGLYCFGITCWDYAIQIYAIRKNIHLINPQYRILVHKQHPIQYSPASWMFMIKMTQLDLNYQPQIKVVQQINNMMLRDIKHAYTKTKHLL